MGDTMNIEKIDNGWILVGNEGMGVGKIYFEKLEDIPKFLKELESKIQKEYVGIRKGNKERYTKRFGKKEADEIYGFEVND